MIPSISNEDLGSGIDLGILAAVETCEVKTTQTQRTGETIRSKEPLLED